MEFNKTETVVKSYKTLFESNSEQSVDTDFTLPDYYPEVTKVLKVLPEISILSSQCSESGVSVGGQVVLTLLYCGSDEEPCSFTHIYPFTKTIEAKDVLYGTVYVEPRVGYMNTKAVAPRKIEVHGSLALCVTVSGINDCAVLSSTDCEGIYLKTKQCESVQLCETVSKSIFIEDEIQIPQTKPTVGKILRNTAAATITECKFVSGKTVVKGDLDIEILYCPPQNGRPILITERRGFSQILDCILDTDSVDYDCSVRVESLELHPKTALDGEVRNIGLEARIGLTVTPFCIADNTVVTDAFSGKYIADVKYGEINTETLCDKIHESFVCKKRLDFGDALDDIYDLWCKAYVDHSAKDKDDLLIKGSVNICILGTDSEAKPVFFERPIDFEHRFKIGDSCGNVRALPQIGVAAVSFSKGQDGSVDVSVELRTDATVFAVRSEKAVITVSVDFDNTVIKDSETAIILYYPENETVWDIAHKYNTDPKKICEANGVEDSETVCNSIMLIPNV